MIKELKNKNQDVKLKPLGVLKLTILFLVICGKMFSVTPVAGFTINTLLCTSSTYTLTDISANVPTAWSYTIDDGFTSTVVAVQNPTINFLYSGIFTISLVATNASGSSAVFTKTISVLDEPGENLQQRTYNTCAGGNPITFTLNSAFALPGNTYSWSTGSTNNSITVSPTTTTIYSITITATNGCISNQTATVNVSTPTLNLTSNPVNICPGVNSTITAAGTGPNPRTYTWSNSSTGSNLTTSLSGVYSVTMTNGSGCMATNTITLGTSTTLSLTITSNPTVVCRGNTVTLRVTGASSYTWSTGATNPSTQVSPTVATTYTVFGKIGNCTGTNSFNLGVVNPPTVVVVASPTSVCAGETITLTANGANNFTINPGAIINASAVITPTSSITYSVRGQNVGCPARTTTLSLQVKPAPAVSIVSSTDVVCSGELVALIATGASSYTWNNGSNQNSIFVNPTTTAVYSVSSVGTNGCSGSAAVTVSVNACTGLNIINGSDNDFMVYPNPSAGSVFIKTNSVALIEIYNITGDLVFKGVSDNTNEFLINVQNLSSGIYLIRNSDNNHIISKKLVVE